jgi:hypothetical protein
MITTKAVLMITVAFFPGMMPNPQLWAYETTTEDVCFQMQQIFNHKALNGNYIRVECDDPDTNKPLPYVMRRVPGIAKPVILPSEK